MQIANASGNHLGKALTLTLEIDDTGNVDECAVVLTLTHGATAKAKAHVLSLLVSYHGSTASLAVHSIALSGVAGCLISCGISAASGPIADCVRKSSNLTDFKNCLSRNGISILAGALSCLVTCIGGI